jgi:hypothetical protein
MLGLVGQENGFNDIVSAMAYFEKIPEDPSALNAIGVLYYQAPEYLERDPAKTQGWGSIRRKVDQAWKYLEKASSKDSLHANFNLGCLHLDSNESKTFSLSKAYEKFKLSAVRGHTLASYNVGVMHYLGMGTFKSC